MTRARNLRLGPYWFQILGSTPDEPGVYVIRNAAGVIYVGQSQSIRTRVRWHPRVNQFICLGAHNIECFIVSDRTDRLRKEAELQIKYRPILCTDLDRVGYYKRLGIV